MFKRLILKVKLYDDISIGFFNDGKENLNSSFRDRLSRVWLAEFYFIAKENIILFVNRSYL